MYIRFQLYAKRVSGRRREACVKYTTGLVHSQGLVSLTVDLHNSYSVAGFYGSITSSFSLLIVTSADVSRVYRRVRGGGVYFQKRPCCSPYSFMLFITETDLG